MAMTIKFDVGFNMTLVLTEEEIKQATQYAARVVGIETSHFNGEQRSNYELCMRLTKATIDGDRAGIEAAVIEVIKRSWRSGFRELIQEATKHDNARISPVTLKVTK